MTKEKRLSHEKRTKEERLGKLEKKKKWEKCRRAMERMKGGEEKEKKTMGESGGEGEAT